MNALHCPFPEGWLVIGIILQCYDKMWDLHNYVKNVDTVDKWTVTLVLLCCSSVSIILWFNLEFGNNSSSWFMCSTSRTSISPIKNITSRRISCCSVAFIEIKFQQKLCFNNQVLMLPSHSKRQCFKTDQVMKNAQNLSVHSLIQWPNVVSSKGH